jgi:hypothetical protein
MTNTKESAHISVDINKKLAMNQETISGRTKL